MAVVIPPFTTSASITGSTLISQADNQLNIMMTEIQNYLSNASGLITSEVYDKTEVQTILPRVGFDTVNPLPLSTGQMAWNVDEHTVDLELNGATLQLGQEQLIRVRNTTASTITNGTAVMATGTIGASGRITVAPANINSSNIKFILGVVTENITAGADGFCTIFGKVRNINTSGSIYGETWADGDTIYVKPSDSGALTNIEPSITQVKLPIAIVIKAHASTGTLFIRVTPIDENHSEPALATKASINQVRALGVALGLTTEQVNTILNSNP